MSAARAIAPGKKAVIWLSSRSVVMKQEAVGTSSQPSEAEVSTPVRLSEAPYSVKSLPTAAQSSGRSPSRARV